jgi:uncharacterized protein (UPF0335 family)
MTKTVVAGVGHNSVDGAALKGFVGRLEALDDERATLVDDMKDVLGEAKAAGLDVKTIRSVLRWRRKEKALREAELEMLESYMSALGM